MTFTDLWMEKCFDDEIFRQLVEKDDRTAIAATQGICSSCALNIM